MSFMAFIACLLTSSQPCRRPPNKSDYFYFQKNACFFLCIVWLYCYTRPVTFFPAGKRAASSFCSQIAELHRKIDLRKAPLMSSRKHVLLCRTMSAAIVAAMALTALPAYADFDGTASQQIYNLSSTTINEGQNASISLRLAPNGNGSGFAGTTTVRLTTNSVVFSRTGNSGFATSTSATNGTTSGTHDFSGSFNFGQDGVHAVSFSETVPMDQVENSSFGLGQSVPGGGSGQSNSANITVLNVAPTIVSATQNGTNGNITVNEGSTVALQMQSTDPGTDAQTFAINGSGAGVGGTSGTRTSSIVNAAAVDQGTLTNTFAVTDDDTTTTLNRSVTVLNVAPTLFGLSVPGGTIVTGETANFSVSASDPGVLDDLTFAWDLDGDGLFDDAITNQGNGGSASDSVVFLAPASPPNSLGLGVRVFDGDGGQDTILFNVIVPEPATVVMMGIGAIGLGLIARRRRKQA